MTTFSVGNNNTAGMRFTAATSNIFVFLIHSSILPLTSITMVAVSQILSVSALSLTAGTASAFQTTACSKFTTIDWQTVKYTCAWEHTTEDWGGDIYFHNIFVKFSNETIVSECFCTDGLATYSPWGSSWTWSYDNELSCYNRDGVKAATARSQFNSAVKCGSPN